MGFSATGFFQWLENHVMEDPYAGLSLPNHQEIYGMEVQGHFFAHPCLKIQANLTWLGNSGPDETYRFLKSISLDPDTGEITREYDTTSYPYDPGADLLFNVMATWEPNERVSLFGRAGYQSSRTLLFPRNDAFDLVSASGVWLFDFPAAVQDVIFPGLDFELSVKNLTDNDEKTPGTYDLMELAPITAQVLARFKW